MQILRAMLNKKIFPQSFNLKATSTKKYLNNKQYCPTDGKNILPAKIPAGSKWVKTDSDCKFTHYIFYSYQLDIIYIERPCELHIYINTYIFVSAVIVLEI